MPSGSILPGAAARRNKRRSAPVPGRTKAPAQQGGGAKDALFSRRTRRLGEPGHRLMPTPVRRTWDRSGGRLQFPAPAFGAEGHDWPPFSIRESARSIRGKSNLGGAAGSADMHEGDFLPHQPGAIFRYAAAAYPTRPRSCGGPRFTTARAELIGPHQGFVRGQNAWEWRGGLSGYA